MSPGHQNILSLLFAALVVVATVRSAGAVDRRTMLVQVRNALHAQYKAAQAEKKQIARFLAAANRQLGILQVEYQALADKLTQTSEAAKDANAERKNAEARLHEAQRSQDEVADQAVLAQPHDSPLRQSRDAYEAALAQRDTAIQRLSESEEFSVALEEAKKADDRAAAVARIYQEKIDNRPEIRSLKADVEYHQQRYKQLRDEFLGNHPAWKTAHQDVQATSNDFEKVEAEADRATKILSAIVNDERIARKKIIAVRSSIIDAKNRSSAIDHHCVKLKRSIDSLNRSIREIDKRRRY